MKLATIALVLLLTPFIVSAQVTFPSRGGTGTSTIPTTGQVLMGQSNGTYAPVATSSLGITGGSGGADTWTDGGATLYPAGGEAVHAQSFHATGSATSTLVNGSSTNFAVTNAFNFLGTWITNVGTWFSGLFDTNFAAKDTDDLTEGTLNLYHTVARAREALTENVVGLEYSTSTGVLSTTTGYVIPLAASTTDWQTAFGWGNHGSAGYLTAVATTTVRGMVSASAPITYNSGTGAFTFSGITTSTAPSTGQIAHWTGAGTLGGMSTGTLTETATGLEFDATRGLLGGAAVLSLTSGFNIPLTASTSQWAAAAAHIHASTTVTGEDYLSLSGQAFTANAVDPDDLEATDFGDYTCNGTTCSLDANTVAASEITDGDYGAFTFASDVATLDANTVSTTTLLDSGTYTDSILTGSTTASGGIAWRTFAALCESITGGSGLCDGSDASAGSGLGTSTAIANTEIIYGTAANTVGSEAAFTYNSTTDRLTVVHASTTNLTVSGTAHLSSSTATSTFAGPIQIGATAGQNMLSVTAAGNYPASNSVGGMVRLTNTSNTGSALVVYSAQTSSAANLVNLRVDDENFLHSGLRIDYDGAGDGLTIVGTASTSNAASLSSTGVDDTLNLAYTGTTAAQGALTISSTNLTGSPVNITGRPAGLGILKVDADGVGDADSSVFSWDASTGGFLGMGQFGKCGTGTKCLNFRTSGNTEVFTMLGTGFLGLGSTTPSSRLTVTGGGYFGGNLTATGTLGVAGHSTLTSASTTNVTSSGTSYLTNLNLSGLFRDSVNASGTAGQVLKSTGTSTIWATDNTAGSGLATSTHISAGQSIFATAANTVGGDNSFFWNNTDKRLGLGTTTPAELLHIYKGTGEFTTIRFDSGMTQGYFFAYDGDTSVNIGANSNSTVNFRTNNSTKVSLTTSLMTLVSGVGLTVVDGLVDLGGATVKQHTYKSFTWPGAATTTSATTTVPLGAAITAEAWNSARCKTTSGSIPYLFKDDGGNLMNGTTATSTYSNHTLSTNNTFTAGEGRNIDIGPVTAAQITCSVDVTVNN